MIIALGHKKGVGKDTGALLVAEKLREEGYGVNVLSFASKLYALCNELFPGFQSKDHYDRHWEEKKHPLPLLGKSPREVLLDVGCFMRSVYANVWVDRTLRDCTAQVNIITDCRFLNEAEAVRKQGGVLVHIKRPSTPATEDHVDCILDGHDWSDYIVYNSGTPEQLRDRLMAIIKARMPKDNPLTYKG
jgi:hypothetical protein